MLIYGKAGRLHQKDVSAANIFEQLEVDFAVSKALQLGFPDRNTDVACYFVGERAVC